MVENDRLNYIRFNQPTLHVAPYGDLAEAAQEGTEDAFAMGNLYRRRDNGNNVVKNGVSLDNRYVVPYNKTLLKQYQVHMNLEWCNQLGLIKYLFKYINKGPYRITASFYDAKNNKKQHKENNDRDEIVEYYNCRYIYACEAYKVWTRRKTKTKSLGRINHVSPKSGDVYYLRILLNKVKGPTCYEDIRTVNGTIYESYKDSCYALGLLDDDREYISSIQETHHWATASFCRSLLVMLITSDSLSRPHHVFKETYNCLSDDVVHVHEQEIGVKGLKLKPEAIYHLPLSYIEKSLLSYGLSLKQIPNMPLPDHKYIQDFCNMLIQDELNYDSFSLESEHQQLHSKLNVEQKISKGEVVINVASSETATLLLSDGRTAHSGFHIPINVNENSFFSITPGKDVVALLNKASLIIWDEAPMMHRHCFEAVDRILRDIILPKNNDKPFGGKTIVFGVLQLTVNMRLQLGYPNNDFEEKKSFADWILKIGEGTIGGPNDGELQNHLDDPLYFQDKSILVPTNEEVDAINDYMLKLMKNEGKTYLSSDSLCEAEASGIPNHKLILKKGVPVMLFCNINQTRGLCNSTRLQIVRLGRHVIEARIIYGRFFNETTYIPRMKLTPSDKKIPFRFQHRQFSIAVCFAMTINKSQGQSLSNVGLYLCRPVFTHGQLYVVVSRVTSKKGLKVLICDEEVRLTNKTKNIVYKEVLQRL
ncbi:uncharacterized protein LOC111914445 [Lactuca sativa]|uniref:uncharacterized protein LOC111914445 n=1 Tax=Lactuca sativa TaxID=4236 RepID=UPI0022AF619B|nr:uncharacterized protein LOC111914445 [Lactuca sativa]